MTNETTKPADEMKDVAAGNIPHPVQTTPGTADADQNRDPRDPLRDLAGGNIPHPLTDSSPQTDPSLNPPGSSIDAADLDRTAAGNIAHPLSDSSPQTDPSLDPPGTTIEVADLGRTAAGVNATPDASGGGDVISDPPYNPDGGGQDSSATRR